MLSLQNAGKRFGPRVLFLEANWLIRSRGKNRAGRRQRHRQIDADEGAGRPGVAGLRRVAADARHEHRLSAAGGAGARRAHVFEECLTVFDELREMEREIERLAGQLAVLDHASPEYEAAAERYSMLQERFHALDGYALDAQVGGVLTGLGFGKEDWARQTDEFSGGWQMRIALAKLLLAKPNLLLLDEPTNHLDLETRNWLEEYLKSYPFGYILISHDRYFLDVTIDRTVEIWNKRLNIYQGNYTKYLSQKDERRTQFQAAYRNQSSRLSIWKPSSTAFAPRPPRPSRCRAASKSWKRSSASRFPKKSR